MRVLLTSIAASLGALFLLAGSAVPAPGPDTSPVRLWSVGKVEQGAGEVPVADGAQVGGELIRTATVGRVVFNLPLHAPYWYWLPRDRAFGALSSSADGKHYSVMAQAPPPNPRRVGAAKGTVTHLDEYQAYLKRADDASLRITISDLLLQVVDDNNSLAAWECPPEAECEPVRTVVRFHARAYAASAGGDFFDAGGVAYLEGHQHSWRPGAATSADSPAPLWGEEQFEVDGDADDSGTGAAGIMSLEEQREPEGPARLRPHRRAVRRPRQPRGRGGRRSRRRVRGAGVHPGPPASRPAADRARPRAARQAGVRGAARQSAPAGAVPRGTPAPRGRAAAERRRLHGRRVAARAAGPGHPQRRLAGQRQRRP